MGETPPIDGDKDEETAKVENEKFLADVAGPCKTTDMGKEVTEPKVGFIQVSEDKRQKWIEFAGKVVRTYVNLEVVPDQMASLKEFIKKRPLAKASGDNNGIILLHYDVKSQGEPVTRPSESNLFLRVQQPSQPERIRKTKTAEMYGV